MLLLVVCLFALFIALLAVPVHIDYAVARSQQLQGHVRIRWLFGIVRYRQALPGRVKRTKRPVKAAAKKRKGRKRGNRVVFAMLRQSAFRQRLRQFIKDLLVATHARDLYLQLNIGTGDPYDTGILWAFLGPLAGVLRNTAGASVHIEPDFIEPRLELRSSGAFRLVPLQFMMLVAAFFLSPVTLRAWRAARQGGSQ